MGFMDKIWGALGLIEHDVKEDMPKTSDSADLKMKKNNNIVSLPSTQQNANNLGAAVAPTNNKPIKVMVVEPFTFDDAQHIADHLKNRKPVVVNLESTEPEVAKRMIDFISGTTYALGGTIQKVGNNIFLCAPVNVDVDYELPQDEDIDKIIAPWKNK